LVAGFSFLEIPVAQSLTGMLAFCRFDGLKSPSFATLKAKGRRKFLCWRDFPFWKFPPLNP
jgi:hypothetical protein